MQRTGFIWVFAAAIALTLAGPAARPARAFDLSGVGFGIHFMSVDLPHGEDDDETNASVNIFGGVVFPGRSLHLFLEGRVALTEWTRRRSQPG